MKKILLSLDPSSTSTGWAIFEYDDKVCSLVDSGQWDLSKGKAILHDRIERLEDNIRYLYTEWRPNISVYETPDLFTQKKFSGAKTQIAYRSAIDRTKGVLWELLGMSNCYGVRVQDWKNSKSKKITIYEVNDNFELYLTLKENDRADAIGLGDAFMQRLGTNREYESDNGK